MATISVKHSNIKNKQRIDIKLLLPIANQYFYNKINILKIVTD